MVITGTSLTKVRPYDHRGGGTAGSHVDIHTDTHLHCGATIHLLTKKFDFVVPSPVDPPTILQVDSRYVFVQWDEASQPNGIILEYILYRNNTYRTKVAHNITRLRVTGLEPFTIYVFSVAACTVVGCSNSSLSLPVRTLEDGEDNSISYVLLSFLFYTGCIKRKGIELWSALAR